jgi:transketolase
VPSLQELSVDSIRTLSMDGVQRANSGHPGTPMALAPLAYVLYTRIMHHSPEDPDWPDRDRFILSAGHASMLLYSTLHLAGYDVSLDDLERFRQLGSPTAGHPEYRHLPGIEMTTGPLGQGIAHSVGFALGERMLAARFNRPGHEVVDHRTFVICSDGDVEEGISSEAGSLAGHLGLGRLIAFYDRNHISIDGDTAIALTEDTPARYEAYGWHVQDIGEDVSLDGLERATEAALAVEDRPSLIVVRTHIAQGSPHKQDTPGAHGSPLGEDEVRETKEVYGWPRPDEPFWVPDEVVEDFGRCKERGRELVAAWRERMDAFGEAEPELAGELERLAAGRLPDGWDADRPTFHAGEGMMATRKAGHTALQWVAAGVPELVGGAADLVASTLTAVDDSPAVEPGDYSGRNVHFGIREHAMCATVNGLVLQGFRAFGSTFLIFSDYCKPSIRLAALMEIGSIFVFTHDSIGLGEDGPTHQPIEQLWSLRATPNVDVIRPSDPNETALAWAHAVRQTRRPTCLALSRQGMPTWNPAAVPDDAIERGAYVLRESFKEPVTPDLILIGTGSEVGICMRAADLLEADDVATRVVSAPCLDRFAEQDADYRDSVLPPDCRARVSVEAGATTGWHRWIGDQGIAIGMETFGASGPQPSLYEHFGFTPERVRAAGLEVTGR